MELTDAKELDDEELDDGILDVVVVGEVVAATDDVVEVTVPPAPAPQTAGSVQAVPALAGATYVCDASTPGCLTT